MNCCHGKEQKRIQSNKNSKIVYEVPLNFAMIMMAAGQKPERIPGRLTSLVL